MGIQIYLTPIDEQFDTGDKIAVIRHEERDGVSDFVSITHSTQRYHIHSDSPQLFALFNSLDRIPLVIVDTPNSLFIFWKSILFYDGIFLNDTNPRYSNLTFAVYFTLHYILHGDEFERVL